MGSGRSRATGAVRTRASHVPLPALVAPLLALAFGVVVVVLAQREVSSMYDRGAGIVDARQFQPYLWRARHEFGSGDAPTEPGAALSLAAAQREVAQAVDRGAATSAWVQRDGSVVAVTTLVTTDATDVVERFRTAPDRSRQVAWVESGRLVVVMAARGLDEDAFARQVGELRTVVRFGRVVSFLLAAYAMFVAIAAVFVGFALAIAPLVLGGAAVRERWRRLFSRPDEAPYADVGLAPGVDVVSGRHPRSQGASLFSMAPIVVLTPLAMVAALRPASLAWFGIGAARWLVGRTRRDSDGVWLRRLLLALFAVGLAHGLLAWPARSPVADRRVLVGAAVVGLVALVQWWRWRRTRHADAVRIASVRGLIAGGHRAGVALTVAGAGSVFTVATGLVPWREQLAPRAWALAGLAVVPVLALGARGAVGLAADERQLRRGRAPVLFLRSFDDDSRRVLSRPWNRHGPERYLPWPLERFEDVLIRALRAVGPVVSIGKPGTRQRQLSATRRLVVGDDWVTAVTEEMARARLVVVVLGRTAGLHTELHELAARGLLGKCCFVVPAVDRAEAAARLAMASQLLGGRDEWGDVRSDDLGDRRRLVALVGLGHRRTAFAHRSRRDSRAYLAQGRFLAGMYAPESEQRRPVPTPERTTS